MSNNSDQTGGCLGCALVLLSIGIMAFAVGAGLSLAQQVFGG